MDVRSNQTPATTTGSRPDPSSTLLAGHRLLPLAGPVFALLAVAGNLTIDDFPGEDTPLHRLLPYYAAHHAQVGRGGAILLYSTAFLALFGVSLWWRTRSAHPVLAGTLLVGTAVAVAGQVSDASTYATLGRIGGLSTTTPGALQAWHISGAMGHVDVGAALLLLAVGLMGLTGRALPSWIGWSALVLCVGYLSPLGFFASLLFLLWAFVVGVVITVRGPDAGTTAAIQ